MKRQASLHIREDDLRRVVAKALDGHPSLDQLVNAIMQQGRKYAASNRSLLVDTQKVAKRARKILVAEDADAFLFAKLLAIVRKQKKHQGIAVIKPGTTNWSYIKEITSLAVQFCNEVGLEKEPGFIYYITECLNKVKKFSLPKLVSLYSAITTEYIASTRIRQDKHKDQTKEAHDIYRKIVSEKIGFSEDYSKMPEKYTAFIDSVDQANKANVDIEVYIKAQFYGLEYRNGIPDPLQLFGDKANERLMKYLYINGISIKEKPKKINWAKIKKLK